MSLLLASYLVSCAKSNDSSHDQVQPDDDKVFSLAGIQDTTFKSDCRILEDDKDRSQLDLIDFSENSFVRTHKSFDGTDCSDAKLRVTNVESLISVRNETASQTNDWLTYVYKYQSVTAQPESIYIAELWNKDSRYGYVNWVVGQGKDVAGRKFDTNSRKWNVPGDVGRRSIKIEGDTITVVRISDRGDLDTAGSLTYKKIQ